MKLYDENGKPLGLYDVCRWWIETYPRDVFVDIPKQITEIRIHMDGILGMRKFIAKEAK